MMQESQVEGAYYRRERPCSVKPPIPKRMAARLIGPVALIVKRRMRCPSTTPSLTRRGVLTFMRAGSDAIHFDYC